MKALAAMEKEEKNELTRVMDIKVPATKYVGKEGTVMLTRVVEMKVPAVI